MTEEENSNRSRRIRTLIYIVAMIALAIVFWIIVVFLQTGDNGMIWAPGPISETPSKSPDLTV